MKKLLMLGGAFSQIPAIKKAKELGYYVITCDYLPKNPGHEFSDEYVNISTTDKEIVLEYAKKADVDGIIAYASDPSAATAAYVSEKMSLMGAGYNATCLLAEKDKFRVFQKEIGCLFPKFFVVDTLSKLTKNIGKVPLPCIVKPVDASGSKGIQKIYSQSEIIEAYKYAVGYSRAKRVIFEEIINTPYCQLHGEGFVYDKKLVFMELGDQRFRDNVPIGTSYPSKLYESKRAIIWTNVEKIIQESGFQCGGLNIEARISESGEVYVIEIGPRTGGNYMPQLTEYSYGFDEVTAVLQTAMGDAGENLQLNKKIQNCFQYIIGSPRNGKYKKIWIHDAYKDKVMAIYLHKKRGDEVHEYKNSSGVVGVAIFKFNTYIEMESFIENIHTYVKVELEEEKYEEQVVG